MAAQLRTAEVIGTLCLATDLGMRPLIAHCRLGQGKLCSRAGKPQEAQNHLTIAAAMYREMNMPFWAEKTELVDRLAPIALPPPQG